MARGRRWSGSALDAVRRLGNQQVGVWRAVSRHRSKRATLDVWMLRRNQKPSIQAVSRYRTPNGICLLLMSPPVRLQGSSSSRSSPLRYLAMMFAAGPIVFLGLLLGVNGAGNLPHDLVSLMDINDYFTPR